MVLSPRLVGLGALIGSALLGALPHRLAAQEPPSLVVIFDGSGSMWGNPEGERRNKLTLARDAVKVGLARIRRETSVGLMSYGHRRSGDCNDVETLVRPEAGATERVGGALDILLGPPRPKDGLLAVGGDRGGRRRSVESIKRRGHCGRRLRCACRG